MFFHFLTCNTHPSSEVWAGGTPTSVQTLEGNNNNKSDESLEEKEKKERGDPLLYTFGNSLVGLVIVGGTGKERRRMVRFAILRF